MDTLLRRLGIAVPILQSGMGGVAGPDLAAAVSNAGGLGILAGLRVPPDVLREQIRELRRRTERPFGVNLWLHDELRPPRTIEDVAPEVLREVQGTLNAIRSAHGLPVVTGPPAATPDLLDAAIDVVVEERVPVFSAGLGVPDAALVERFHDAGTAVMAMVTDVADALAAVWAGIDVVVAQGAEAGGHRSTGAKRERQAAAGTTTMVLVPVVRDAVGPGVPVVAAGGIADGRGIAAALALGADGVLLGTRFVATVESTASEPWKATLLAHDRPTVLTDALTGQWARALRNDFVDAYDASGAATLPSLLQLSAAGDVFAAGRRQADPELQPMYAGESARLVTDLPTAGAVVARLVAEAEAALGRPLGTISAG